MKKLKLKALGLGAKEILSREQLKNVLGGSGTTGTTVTGSGDGHCKTGGCKLFVTTLGIEVDGTCTDYHTGGSIRCACVNGNYSTDPGSWSVCNK